MRAYVRLASLAVALGLLVVLPLPVATGKPHPCLPPKVKVGGLCVKSRISSSKGVVAITVVRDRRRPGVRRRVVDVALLGSFTRTCTDGTTEQTRGVETRGWEINGSSFGGTQQSGGLVLHGHWAAANKAVIATYSDTIVSTNKTCRLQISNVTIKG